MELSDFYGILIGLATFLTIGLFHPVVVKAEYYFSARCWWIFLILGIISLVATFFVESSFWSAILGVVGFSSFWSIQEVIEQEERVKKGWFPDNPKRKFGKKK